MSEEVFRITITVGVALASIAFLVQAIAVLAAYRAVRQMQRRFEPLAQQATPVIESAKSIMGTVGKVVDKTGPSVDEVQKILATTSGILQDTRPRIAEISGDVAAITREGRGQVKRIGELLHDAGDRARSRLEQIDQTVGTTVEQVEHAGDSVKRAVLRPVREVNGIAAGISAAVSTLVKGPRRSSVDSATQDEEMFI